MLVAETLARQVVCTVQTGARTCWRIPNGQPSDVATIAFSPTTFAKPDLAKLGIRTDLVFATSEGGPILRRNPVKRHFKPLLLEAKLPADFSLYGLHHTCATLLLQAGVHPKIVAERLGHSSTTLTMDVYSHVVPGIQTEATAQLERMLYG